MRGGGRSIGALLAVGGVVGACVLAEPATNLPTLPDLRPTIVRGSVVPTASAVLATWPAKFIVPVELIDPRETIVWAAFVDYNSVANSGFDSFSRSTYEASSTSDNIRLLQIPITQPSSDKCHLVEVVVAKNLNTSFAQTAHTPLEPGGDIVSWFYNPSGDLDGCPSVDAGFAPVADAGADAGDGGT